MFTTHGNRLNGFCVTLEVVVVKGTIVVGYIISTREHRIFVRSVSAHGVDIMENY